LPHEAKQTLPKKYQTQLNSCSIFGSQHYNNGHFKDTKVGLASYAMRSSAMNCKISNQKNSRYSSTAHPSK